MPFTVQSNRTSATGSGSTGQEIAFTFPISATSDLSVKKRITATGVETNLAETTNYTVVISGTDGGTLTTVTAIETTEQIHIIRDTPNTQELDLEQGGSFNANNIDSALDKNTKLGIENKDTLTKSIKFPTTDASSLSAELPSSTDRASKVCSFDSDGNVTAIDAVPEGSVSFTTAGTNMAEAASVAAQRLLLTLGWNDVRDFGAIGDGTTDDRAAIQLALDDSKTTFKAVYFPAGKYRLTTSALTFTINDSDLQQRRIIMFGDGSGTEIYQETADVNCITIGNEGTDVKFLQDVQIFDMRIGCAAGTGTALALKRAPYFRIRNIDIPIAGKYAIEILGSANGSMTDVFCSVNGPKLFGSITSTAPTDAWVYGIKSTNGNLTLNLNALTFTNLIIEGGLSTNGIHMVDVAGLTINGGNIINTASSPNYMMFFDGGDQVRVLGMYIENQQTPTESEIRLKDMENSVLDCLVFNAKVNLINCLNVRVSGLVQGPDDIFIDEDCTNCILDNLNRPGSGAPGAAAARYIDNASRSTHMGHIANKLTASTDAGAFQYGIFSKGHQLLAGGLQDWDNSTNPIALPKVGTPTIAKTGAGLTDTTTLFGEVNGTFCAKITHSTLNERFGLKFPLDNNLLNQWITVEAWINVTSGVPFVSYTWPDGTVNPNDVNKGRSLLTSSVTGEWLRFQGSFRHTNTAGFISFAKLDVADATVFYLGAVNIWSETNPFFDTNIVCANNAVICVNNEVITVRS